ncbi:hypothetical protein Q4589_14280 [Cobetia marina]|uniref:hypothetical protein n=1 Tax=Cobetia marina TaxID=28258 RepID=UPI0026E42163|nr:hypothetical protein [Cobetia marina]MDO6788758.1 hypothetical protein [Cobetia marina]
MPSALGDYIGYYRTLSKPGYAVLVTGEWGVGKTYQVLKLFEEDERYYISLFGIGSIEQIDAEVVALCNPVLSRLSVGIEQAGQAANNLGGGFVFSSLSSAAFNAVFKKSVNPDRVLIFDGLERSLLDMGDLLGVINQYVEHHGFCVIVIAHDKKIIDDISSVKEKVFGQTLRVELKADDAYDAFILLVDSKYRDILTRLKSLIVDIFFMSENNSLRVLRHVVEDIARLLSCLSKKIVNDYDLVVDLVKLHVSLNVEVRAGVVTEGILKNRYQDKRNKYIGDKTKTLIDEVNDKYIDVDVFNTVLSNKTLCSMFFLGCYDASSINSDVENSIYGDQIVADAPWKIVSSFDELADDVVQEAVDEMERQFINREVTGSGEMLHMFSLKMMMADKNVVSETVGDIKDQCKEYVLSLYNSGILPPREKSYSWVDSFTRSYDGVGYWVNDSYSAEFIEVFHYLVDSREKALFNQSNVIWKDLKDKMYNDPSGFMDLIGANKTDEAGYQLIPILSYIEVEEFIDAWMTAPVNNWRDISSALSIRYSHGRINDELKDEREWAKNLYIHLLDRSQNEVGLKSLRIQRIIPLELYNCFSKYKNLVLFKSLNFEFIDGKTLRPLATLILGGGRPML